jgi:hypothetical protein
MKKKHYLIISLTLLAIVLVSVLLFVQVSNLYNPETSKNLAFIDYSNTYATVSTVYQRKTFLFNGTYWLFYCNGTNLFYANSLDGLNWSKPVTIASGLSASGMSVWFENGTIHYTHTEGLDVPVTFRKGQITGNEIVWEAEQEIVLGASNYEYYNAYSTVDSEGRPWVSFMRSEDDFPDTWYTVQVTRANSPTAGQWSPPMQISNTSLLPLRPCLIPLPDAQIYAVYVSQNGIEGKLWNGTNWQTEESITIRHPVKDYAFSAVGLNGEVHLAFVENATNRLYHYRRFASGEWQENLIASQGDSVAAVLSADPSTNTLYCLWITGDTLHLSKMQNGVWIEENIEKLFLESPQALSVFYETTEGKLGVALLERISITPAAYKLRYFVAKNL